MLIFNKDFGLGTMNDQGGVVINNQDMTITTNGEYTADEGYTGIGTATVNVPEADVIIATNNTGAAITAGEKVWLNESGGSYNIDSFDSDNTFIESYGKLSSTTISSSHIVTISSNNNGIIAPIVFPFSTANTWEFVTRIKPSSSLSSQSFGVFFCADYASTGILECLTRSGAFMYVQNGQTVIFQGSAGSQVDWGVGIGLSGYDWVYIKGEFTGSEYKLSTSTDGVTWSEPQTTTSSVICAQPTCGLRIGSPNYSDSYSYKGDIDLTKTYLKVNGEIVWQAVNPKINVTTDSLTGIAKENIASGSTGQVETILPEN